MKNTELANTAEFHYHSKESAERIREKLLKHVDHVLIVDDNGKKARLDRIVVNSAAFHINVDGEIQPGYLCIMHFDGAGGKNAAVIARLNGLGEVGGLFPAIG